MAKAPKIYRRLPGTGTNLVQHVRLYQGPDHLLQVSSTGYSESYKRFYYVDVQAVLVRETKRWVLWNWALGIPLAATLAYLFFILSQLRSASAATTVYWFFLALPLAVPFLLNLLAGPTCVCHLRTAVQTERLLSIKRLRKARRFIEQLRPLLETAQGTVRPENAAGLADDGKAVAPESLSPAPDTPQPLAQGLVPNETGPKPRG